MSSSIFLGQVMSGFIADEANSLPTRKKYYEKFGTTARAMYTMFEVTFSGGWPSTARPMIEQVSPWFAVWWVLYTTLVWFAVVRVMSALFLKQTMNVAANDAEQIALAKTREKETFVKILQDIFQEADCSGDGIITQDEFDVMIGDHLY